MPVEITQQSNGNIKEIKVTNEEGELHNSSGPSVQGWYKNRQEEHREY